MSNYSVFNLFLFTFLIILAVWLVYLASRTNIVFNTGPVSNSDNPVILDLKIPVHVLSNNGSGVYYKVPDGRFDGDSIILIMEKNDPTSRTDHVIISLTNIKTSSFAGQDTFYPFAADNEVDTSAIFRMIWYQGFWYLNNNSID